MKLEFYPTMSDSAFFIALFLGIIVFLLGIWFGMFLEEELTRQENMTCYEMKKHIEDNNYKSQHIERYFKECLPVPELPKLDWSVPEQDDLIWSDPVD